MSPRPMLMRRSRRSFRRRLARRSWILVAAVCVLVFQTACIQVEMFGGRRGPRVETRVAGTRGPKILMVDIDGIIREEATSSFLTSTESTVARVREQLDAARADASVKAVLLRVDTPGGSATASDVIYSELLRFKQDRGVPILAHFMGMAASGGYYVAMAADEIDAEPTNVTGSIGVIFVGLSFAGLMDKLGVEDQTVTGGKLKDAGSPLRHMTRQERAIFQSVIDDLHARFRKVVAAGRPELSEARVAELADGRIYSAPQALENGLIDSIGSIEDTVAKIEKRLGVEESVVVSYHRRGEWRRNLYTKAPAAPSTIPPLSGGILDVSGLARMMLPGFHYLWWPGAPR